MEILLREVSLLIIGLDTKVKYIVYDLDGAIDIEHRKYIGPLDE